MTRRFEVYCKQKRADQGPAKPRTPLALLVTPGIDGCGAPADCSGIPSLRL
jgi:hypothetical protein